MNYRLSILIVFLATSLSYADNWPHWRGDGGNGVSLKAKPPTEWSETKNVKWKVAVPGRGSGSPVVWENKVFVVTAAEVDLSTKQVAIESGQLLAQRPERGQRGRPSPPNGERRRRGGRRGNAGPLPTLQFKLLCFNRSNGDLLWEKIATTAKPHEGTHSTNGFASASPCTDGEHVYAHFGSRGLFCYSLDGELKWSRTDLGDMKTRATFGEGSSPTIVDDKIIVPWDHEGPSYIAALNKYTGKEIWKTERDEPTCWATPLVVEHEGKKQIVMNGQNYARSYDAESGKELWRCSGQTNRPVASAVAMDGLVLVGSGYQGSFLGAFELDGKGDIRGSDNVVWSIQRNTPDIASPVLSENRIYFHKGKDGIISCYDAKTGKAHYTAKRLPLRDRIYASPIAANGHVYFTDRSGTTVVIQDSTELKVVATNSLGETIDATPAPVDNELFIRGENHLFCIATK